MTRTLLALSLALLASAASGQANDDYSGIEPQLVRVTVTGQVEYNQINVPPLNAVGSGETATLSFLLSSDQYDDSASFPTRGYRIINTSFSMDFASASVGLPFPFPAGETAYFVIRDNDPAVDGFLLSNNVDFPFGVPTDANGIFGPFYDNWYVTYGGDLLDSLDILGAIGTYDFTGLTVFNWTMVDGPFDAMGLIFEQLTIELVPEPWTDLGGGLGGVGGVPALTGSGDLVPGGTTSIALENSVPGGLAWIATGLTRIDAPFYGGTFVPSPDALDPVALDTNGDFSTSFRWPKGLPPGTHLYFQAWVEDGAAPFGWAGSNALETTQP